jgi:hypothetical protein
LCIAVIPTFRRLRWENGECKPSIDYIASPITSNWYGKTGQRSRKLGFILPKLVQVQAVYGQICPNTREHIFAILH